MASGLVIGAIEAGARLGPYVFGGRRGGLGPHLRCAERQGRWLAVWTAKQELACRASTPGGLCLARVGSGTWQRECAVATGEEDSCFRAYELRLSLAKKKSHGPTKSGEFS